MAKKLDNRTGEIIDDPADNLLATKEFAEGLNQMIDHGKLAGASLRTGDGRVVEFNGTRYDNGKRPTQISMPGLFPSMKEHMDAVVGSVRVLVGNAVDSGLTARAGASIEIAGQFTTPEGVLMDSVVKVSVKAQPAKVE